MSQNIKEQVKAYFAQHREAIVKDIADLCTIPSEKSAAVPGAPFGENCAKAVEAARQKAEQMGFETQSYADEGYALAWSGNGDKTIGFFGHCDVVPAGTGWTLTQPYAPIEKDGTLVARGAADNKNGIVSGLWVMKAVKDLNLPVRAKLMTYMGSDEESGMEDVIAFAKNRPMPDLCIIPDSDFPVCHGEKGIMDAVFRCKTPFNQIIGINGGLASNVILGEATAQLKGDQALLNQLREKAGEGYHITAEGDIITIAATGRSSHASRPDGSLNAARMLADLLVQCDIDPSDKKIMDDISTALRDDYGETMGFAAEDAESGKMTVACGIVKTEEGRISLTFNPRYCVTIDGEQVAQGFKNYFEPRGWENVHLRDSKGYYIPKDDPRVTALMSIYRELTGDTSAEAYVMGGGTYARKLKNALAFGPEVPGAKLPYELPYGHGGVHQPDEALLIDDMIRAIELYTIALVEVDQVL